MIDFHTHILPGIDDGSDNTAMTAAMLDMERAQGIDHICATPHFYAHRRSVDEFLERRNRSFAHVWGKLFGAGISRAEISPKITLGAEVYYFQGMGRAAQLPQLCFEGTNVLLLEMPFEQWSGQVYTDVYEIIRRQKLTVVLAHLERYFEIQKKKDVWDDILDLPLYIQLNAGDFLERGKKRKFCIRAIKEYDNVIIGSDAHNTADRKPNIEEAKAVIEKKGGPGTLGRMQINAEGLLGYGK